MKLSRILTGHLFCLTLLTCGSALVSASDAPYTLPKLPYPMAALEPVISAESLALHHDETHNSYLHTLNREVANDPKLEGITLSALLAHASTYNAAVNSSAGGHYNHSFFWTIMAPVGTGGEPSPALRARLVKDFGSTENMQSAFEAAGNANKGSGWVWLVWTGKKLVVSTTANESNPLMDDAEIQGSPILANDLWEHAYFPKFQNHRADYLHAWWTIVNWKEANSRFAEAATGPN